MDASSPLSLPRTVALVGLMGAGKSAMWKTITNKAAPLVEQLQTLRQAQITSLPMPRAFAGLTGSDVAELAVALEGEKILSDLQSSQFDPNSGFIVVLRLTENRDVNDLIQQGLEAIDKEVPGLRNQIEKSRRRIGAAEVFDVPSEALDGQKLPFTLSCAIGSGKDGTIIALGRSENLQAFLSGKTEGTLRGQINDTLSRRGQFWLYFPVPKDATKSLEAGAAVAGARSGNAGQARAQGAKARAELGSGDVYSRRTRRRISRGDDLEPEMIVIRQIQQRSVEIQQYGIYMAPIGLFNGSRRHGGAARNTGAYDTSRGAVGAGPLS